MEERPDEVERAPEPEEELPELDLIDPLKREDEMPGHDAVVPIPPE